jgi:curved DNA-binding protein CbpA
MKTLYDVLQVHSLADGTSIDEAYQRLIAQWAAEPGSAPGTDVLRAARREAIERAYAVLSDPLRRTAYDERNIGREAVAEPGLLRLTRSVNWHAAAKAFALSGVGVLGLVGSAYLLLHWDAPSAPALAVTERLGSGIQLAGAQAPTTPNPAADANTGNERLAAQQLALENERLKVELEVIRREQDRRDRMLDITASGVAAERAYREMAHRYEENTRPAAELVRGATEEAIHQRDSDARVRTLEKAADMQRDVAAARLGITRGQYERVARDRFRDSYYDGTGWHEGYVDRSVK